MESWLTYKKSDPTLKRVFYRKIWSIILLITSIQGLFIGLAIYWVAKENIGNELLRLHRNQIVQRAENIDDQFAYLEMMFAHWAFDPKFDDKLKNLDFRYKYEQILDLYRTLLVMEGNHPLIQGVELYLNTPRPFIINKNIYVYLEDQSDISRYQHLLQQKKPMFWTEGFRHKTLQDDETAITVVNHIPGGSSEPIGFITASLNKERMVKLLKTLTPYNEGSTFLMPRDGSWIISGNEEKNDDLVDALRAKLAQNENQPDAFLFNYNNVAYSVSYGQFSRLGTTWIYVSAAPLTAVTKPVIFISQIFLVVSFGGLMLALVLSWLASHRLYSPIDRLVRLLKRERGGDQRSDNKDEFEWIEGQWTRMAQESRSLRNRLEDHLPIVRESFIHQFVQGYQFALNEEEIAERLSQYGWDLSGRLFVILIVQLSGLSNLNGRFSPGDEGLLTFAAANIAKELAEQNFEQFHVLNFHDLSIALLVAVPSEMPVKETRKHLRGFAEQLMEMIHRILKMRISLSISKMTQHIKQIPFLLEESRQALSYRNLSDENQVIDQEELNISDPSNAFYYPLALEKEIIRCIQRGSEDDAVKLIGRFLQELSDKCLHEVTVQHAMLQLLGGILHTLMQSGVNTMKIYEGANLFEQLVSHKEKADLLRWFQNQVIEPIIRELISKQDYHLKQMVDKTVVMLKERYMMTDLSLEYCADQFGTSPYTLSRVFKQITGTNFIDYLSNLRIERAKDLLLGSDMKITDIADRVGYQNNYFTRVFKKYEGITPGQFRERYRSG
ncbi:helix-turn-helix domain-containing protein [Paenibacillus piri]|uniref:AraC family transcriptional regulator n=1 Tax=Paenibacillus piri TaxID=2547395 RepID=A0A4R5K9Z5_9BACL|nr:helix-turn-helix domain-containing protein [Paenibacillus piri]TDF92003.1 AraC family transcriptional regulator [Paenibacillus piri]